MFHILPEEPIEYIYFLAHKLTMKSINEELTTKGWKPKRVRLTMFGDLSVFIHYTDLSTYLTARRIGIIGFDILFRTNHTFHSGIEILKKHNTIRLLNEAMKSNNVQGRSKYRTKVDMIRALQNI